MKKTCIKAIKKKKKSYNMLPNTQSTDDIISIRISLEFYEVVLSFNNRTEKALLHCLVKRLAFFLSSIFIPLGPLGIKIMFGAQRPPSPPRLY